jgi:hypothetical protein
MSPSNYKCPLCGYQFDRPDKKCRACPMSGSCNVICCPNCGYGFVGESRIVAWLRRLLRPARRSRRADDEKTKKGDTL